MNALIGPFLGEFGYEVALWQGAVRHYLESSLFDKVIVGCRKGHECLYELATDFEYFTPTSNNTQAMCIDGRVPTFNSGIIKRYNPCIIKGVCDITLEKQSSIKFGNSTTEYYYDVLFHVRNSTKYSTARRNWPIEKWKKLKEMLKGLKIGCIGTNQEAIHLEGTDNLRGYPLSLLADIMASSKIVVGPSSGAMHLASFCGAPHIVWCGKAIVPGGCNIRYRYETSWNPLKTKAIVVDDYGWNPPEDIIYNEIIKIIKKEKEC
jgi:hypothetical protein